MQPTDWSQINLQGYDALIQVVQKLEQNLAAQEKSIVQLQQNAGRARMAAWWMNRYLELYQTLVTAGMPAELEGDQISAWLRSRLAQSARPTASTTVVTDDDGVTWHVTTTPATVIRQTPTSGPTEPTTWTYP